MKLSELKGRAVVHIDNAEKIGELVDLLVDPESRQVVGMRCGTVYSENRFVPAAQVKSVGADAITVLGSLTGAAHAPVDTMIGDSAGVDKVENSSGGSS